MDARQQGFMPRRDTFEAALMGVLVDHYAQVYATMHGHPVHANENFADVVGRRAGELQRQAYIQAGLIFDTLSKDMLAVEQAHTKGYRPLDLKGRITDAFRKTAQMVRDAFKRRLPGIANTNTNGVAEQARADAMEELEPGSTGRIHKRWVTEADERVRPSHVRMHGVAVPVGEMFDVSGYAMNQPGDMSNGAPLREVINCRCWLQFVDQNEDGSWTIVGETPRVPVRRRPNGPQGMPTQGENRPRPTSAFTFTGKPSRGTVILGNGERATFSAGPGGVVVRVNRKPIASASLIRNADGTFSIRDLNVDRAYQLSGVDQLIRNSVAQTNLLPR